MVTSTLIYEKTVISLKICDTMQQPCHIVLAEVMSWKTEWLDLTWRDAMDIENFSREIPALVVGRRKPIFTWGWERTQTKDSSK